MHETEIPRRVKVGGIMCHDGLATISIFSLPEKPDVPGAIFQTLGERNINIEFIAHTIDEEGRSNITLGIEKRNLETARAVLERIKPVSGARKIGYNEDVVVISVFGPHFRERPLISGRMFSALGSAGISVLAISTSISSCSCLINADKREEALRVLHEAFEAPHHISK